MIKQLKDTYVYLPLIPFEESREISVLDMFDGSRIYLYIRRNGLPTVSVVHQVPLLEIVYSYEHAEAFDERILLDLCNRMKKHLEAESNGS